MSGVLYVVEAVDRVTCYVEETPKQEAARIKARKPLPTYSYMSVRTRPVLVTPENWGRGKPWKRSS